MLSVEYVKKYLSNLVNTLELKVSEDEIHNNFLRYYENNIPEKVDIVNRTNMDNTQTHEYTQLELSQLTVAKLKEICKQLKLKVSGKKQELIDRILGGDSNTSTPKNSSKPSKPSKPSVKKSSVIQKYSNQTTLRKNAYGNYCHPETNFVFEPSTKRVYGVQQDDGSVSELTKDNIETCKLLSFEYEISNNLDTADVKLEDKDKYKNITNTILEEKELKELNNETENTEENKNSEPKEDELYIEEEDDGVGDMGDTGGDDYDEEEEELEMLADD